MNLGDYLTGSNGWIVLGAITLAILVALYANRHSSFWLTELSYTFPLIGKLHRFSNDYSKSSHKGWLNVENTLCRDYAKHMSTISKPKFENNIEYLRKTYDLARKPMPKWILALIALLVVMEGFGFSYLLGGFMAAESSENTRQLLMVGIVVVLASVLLWTTHAAGHQLFRTNLLRDCFKQHQASDEDHGFTSRIIKLNERQSIDDDVPEHVQCANRIATRPGDRGSYSWMWITLTFIVIVAIGSTVLRMETLASTEADEAISGAPQLFQAAATAVAAAVAAAPDAGAIARHNAALAGFVLLAVIFLITQAVGMSVGYKYGFVGMQSMQAYKATSGEPDYHSYFAPFQHKMNVARLRLHKLHQLLESGAPKHMEFTKTFLDFIVEERKRGALDLHEPPKEPTYDEMVDEPSVTTAEAEPKAAQSTKPRMAVVSETQSEFEGKPQGESPAVA